jgi:hypothetical protein
MMNVYYHIIFDHIYLSRGIYNTWLDGVPLYEYRKNEDVVEHIYICPLKLFHKDLIYLGKL